MYNIIKLKKEKSEYLSTIFTKMFIVAIGFINTVIVNRYLGPELKGEYAYIMNAVNILSLFLGLGINQSYIYLKRSGEKNLNEKVVTLSILQFLFLFIIQILLYSRLNTFQNIIFIISSVTVLYNNLTHIAMITDINRRNRINRCVIIFYNIILFFLLIFTKDNFAFFISIVILKIILETLIFIYFYKFMLFIKFKLISIKLILKIIKVSFIPMIMAILISLNYNIDIVVMKKLLSSIDIGIYSLAVTIAGMMWIIPDAFKEVLLRKNAVKDSKEEIIIAIKINLLISVAGLGLFCIFGRIFINVIYGIDYKAAFVPTVILLIGTIPMIIFKLISTIYVANGKQKYIVKVLLVAVIINIILNYVMIPLLKVNGAAISSVCSYFISGVALYLNYKSQFNR